MALIKSYHCFLKIENISIFKIFMEFFEAFEEVGHKWYNSSRKQIHEIKRQQNNSYAKTSKLNGSEY